MDHVGKIERGLLQHMQQIAAVSRRCGKTSLKPTFSQGPVCRASPSRSRHDSRCECTGCLRKAVNFDRVSQQAELLAAQIICYSKLHVVVFARQRCRQCLSFTAMTRSFCTENQQTICRENQNPLYAFWPRHVCCAPCSAACNELHSHST